MASASRTESLRILRTLYRELRPTVNSPHQHVYETQLWKYIVGLCRSCSNSSPSPKMCEAQRNLEGTGQSYVYYLQGSREYHRISDEYKGAGERTAAETATMLGFKMPDEPRDPSVQRSNSQSSSLLIEKVNNKISSTTTSSRSRDSG